MMYKYALKRLLLMIPVFLGIIFIIFGLMSLAPGDPARMILGESADQTAVDALRAKMGLNDSFIIQFFRYVGNILKGDFGKSYMFKIPVFDVIGPRIPTTIYLALGSVWLMVLFGVPIGVISAVKKYTWIDNVTLTIALFLNSMPAFWLGLILMLVFGLYLKCLPPTGSETFSSFIMPWITLAAGMMASLVRQTRSSMLDVIKQDYIRTARAKGAKERVVIYQHALRNALMTVITIIGLNFASLLGGSMIVESVFAMNGLGSMIITAVRMKDTPLVIAGVLLVALMAGIVNLVVDILYAYVDPRVKSLYVKPKKKKAATVREVAAQ